MSVQRIASDSNHLINNFHGKLSFIPLLETKNKKASVKHWLFNEVIQLLRSIRSGNAHLL